MQTGREMQDSTARTPTEESYVNTRTIAIIALVIAVILVLALFVF